MIYMKNIKITLMVILMILLTFDQILSNTNSDIVDLKIDSPILIDSSVFLYQAGDFFLGGQPEMETLDTLVSLGVTLIINIRTEQEVNFQKSTGYDEESYVIKKGLDYIHVPIGGVAGYTPEAINAINNSIKLTKGKVLIHCRSAGRATLAWMAWLIRYNNYSIDDAVDLGKMARFTFPLEELLGFPVSMEKSE